MSAISHVSAPRMERPVLRDPLLATGLLLLLAAFALVVLFADRIAQTGVM